MSSDSRLTTGQMDFSYGVDSSRVPLVASIANPNGLPRNALSWLTNGVTRGGGVGQRTGYEPRCTVVPSGLYQGGWLYDASELGGNPYLMLSISGRMYQVRIDTDNSVHDITGAFQDPATAPQAYFAQDGRFMVKQAGDGKTLPLFWDGGVSPITGVGNGLSRSRGIIGANHTPAGGATPFNQLPAATAMVSYQGRIWYARNRTYTAGDITGDQASGTAPFNFEDSVLYVTENPLATGGDGFKVPSTAGLITALNYPIALDQTLGQGPLAIFTDKQVYYLTVPISRTAWIGANANNQPLQSVVMRTNGSVSDRCVVSVNGDLYYQSFEPQIRSLVSALRYFQTFGNGSISNNINRVLQFNDRSLMNFASGCDFNNRLYQTVLPVVTPVGTAFQQLAVLDFDPTSTLQDQRPATWDGTSEGLDFLQVWSGNFGGVERMFAAVHSRVDGSIQVWEVTSDQRFENGDNRVNWWFETPAFDWSEYPRTAGGGAFELKELDGLDLWLDKVFGDVNIQVQYRPDEDACWYDWIKTKICASRTSCEDVNNPVCYPTVTNREQYRMPLSFPKPKANGCSVGNNRPTTWGYKFQIKLTFTGWCRVRGYHLHCLPKESSPFYHQVC